MNHRSDWPFICVLALLAGLLIGTWVDDGARPSAKPSLGYLFEPEPGCEPHRPGSASEGIEHKAAADCSSPFRNNPGFITTADIKQGTVFCTHYTTQLGGPTTMTWEALEDPYIDPTDKYGFGHVFRAKSNGGDEGSYRSWASGFGLEPFLADHIQLYHLLGWNAGNFSTAGPCQTKG